MTRRDAAVLLGGAAILVTACGPSASEGPDPPPSDPPGAPPAKERVASLLGEPLHAPVLDPETAERRGDLLEQAREALRANPADPESSIELARRCVDLGRYVEALNVLNQGVLDHPDDAGLRRERGRVLFTLRRFEEAVADWELGDAPLDLGVALYASGDYVSAESALRDAVETGADDDARVEATFWRYLALRRLGRETDARALLRPIHEGLSVRRSRDHHRLLLMFLDEDEPEPLLDEIDRSNEQAFVTTAYGVANAHLYAGRAHRATELLWAIVRTDAWDVQAYITAEADLARMGEERY